MTDVNYTYWGIHFTIYTDIESLCCIPETHNVTCQLYCNFNNDTALGKSLTWKLNLKYKNSNHFLEKSETRNSFSTLNRRDPSHNLTSNSDRKETGIIRENIQSQACYLKDKYWDFPVSPVVKTLCFQCRGYGFISWPEELRSHMPWSMAKLTHTWIFFKG